MDTSNIVSATIATISAIVAVYSAWLSRKTLAQSRSASEASLKLNEQSLGPAK